MATKAKAQPPVTMYRVSIEVPAKPNAGVVKALRAVGAAFPGAQIEEVKGAAPNSYSLTIHAFPDKEKE